MAAISAPSRVAATGGTRKAPAHSAPSGRKLPPPAPKRKSPPSARAEVAKAGPGEGGGDSTGESVGRQSPDSVGEKVGGGGKAARFWEKEVGRVQSPPIKAKVKGKKKKGKLKKKRSEAKVTKYKKTGLRASALKLTEKQQRVHRRSCRW